MVILYKISQISTSFILFAGLSFMPCASQAKAIVNKSDNKDKEISFSIGSQRATEKTTVQPDNKVLVGRQIEKQTNNNPEFCASRGGELSVATVDITIWNGSSWDNGAPTENFDVVINGNYSNDGFTAKNLVVSQGANVNLSSNIELKGNGENQSVNTILGTIVLNGSSTQTWKGKIQNLTLDNAAGANFSGITLLTGSLKLQTGTLTTNGNLTLVSNALGTARVAKIEADALILGNVTVQRRVTSAKAGWCFISTSVLNQTKADWADDFYLLQNYVMLHNEGGTLNAGEQINGWEFAPNNIEVGKGYRAFLNQGFFSTGGIIDNTGPIFTGPKNFPIGFSPAGYNGGGWNLISNPYPCEIDWHILSKSLIDGQIHIWNNKIGSYASYTQGTGISNSGASRYIPSGQSFFVKANAAGAALYIDENAKPETPQTNSFLRITADPQDVARFTLRDAIGGKDETAVRWMDETSSGFDSYYDANKIYSSGSINLFSVTSEGYNVSIQARPFHQKDSINLGYNVLEGGNYFLQIKIGQDIFDGKTWLLKDKQTGLSEPVVESEMIHSFQVPDDGLNTPSRFLLIGYAPFVGNKPNLVFNKFSLFPNPTSDKFHIENASDIQSITVFDLNGKEVLSSKNDNKSILTFSTAHLNQGIYTVKLLTSTSVQTHKLVKK